MLMRPAAAGETVLAEAPVCWWVDVERQEEVCARCLRVITFGGQMVRTGVEHIRMTGRNAQGVKLINLHGDDRLLAIAPVISEDDEGDPAE